MGINRGARWNGEQPWIYFVCGHSSLGRTVLSSMISVLPAVMLLGVRIDRLFMFAGRHVLARLGSGHLSTSTQLGLPLFDNLCLFNQTEHALFRLFRKRF